MKLTLMLAATGVITFFVNCPNGNAQGTFQNLGFESAVIVTSTAPFIQFGPAFPGWTGYFGGTPASQALYNTITLGSAAIGLHDANSALSTLPLVGNYSAIVQSSGSPSDFDVSLAQTGVVPVGTLSLRLVGIFSPERVFVTMNGQPLSLNILQDFGTYREFGADISPFAGQTAELRFTQPHGPGLSGNFALDNIAFSSVAVPEPSTWALFALGSALCWCATRRRRK